MGNTTMTLKQFEQSKVQTVLNVYCVMDKKMYHEILWIYHIEYYRKYHQ